MSFAFGDDGADLFAVGRYCARRSASGWEVFDTARGTTATLNDKALKHSGLADAQTVAGFLNEFDAQMRRNPSH